VPGIGQRAGVWIGIGIGFWLLILGTLVADVVLAYWWRAKLLNTFAAAERPDLADLHPLVGRPLWGILHLARSLLSFAVVGFLGLSLLYVLVERPTNHPEDLIQNLITLVGTLATAVVAFYFGSRAAESTSRSDGGGGQTPRLPQNTISPAIRGRAAVGETLAATNGAWSGEPTYAYRWERERDGEWESINGATDPSYELTEADRGQRVRVVVSATGRRGGAAEQPSAPTPIVDDLPPGPPPPPEPPPEPPAPPEPPEPPQPPPEPPEPPPEPPQPPPEPPEPPPEPPEPPEPPPRG
jgi:hypothetical protein